MRFPFPRFTTACTLLCLWVALALPVISSGQSLGELARQIRAKKKSPESQSKVWTNETIRGLKGHMSVVGAPPPPPPAAAERRAQPAPAAGEADPIWAELDTARSEKEAAERYIATLQQQIDEWEGQLANQTDPDVAQTYSVSISGNQEEIARQQALLMEINARLADLEQRTAGKTRPTPEPAQAPAPAQGEGEAEAEAAPPPPASF